MDSCNPGRVVLFFGLSALQCKVHYVNPLPTPELTMRQQDHRNLAASGFRDAVLFWEPRRVWYNALLTLSALLWLVLTWPHFRPALTWLSFAKMMVLALLANLCYCAGYVAEFFIQGALPVTLWRGVRYALFVIGMLIALAGC